MSKGHFRMHYNLTITQWKEVLTLKRIVKHVTDFYFRFVPGVPSTILAETTKIVDTGSEANSSIFWTFPDQKRVLNSGVIEECRTLQACRACV